MLRADATTTPFASVRHVCSVWGGPDLDFLCTLIPQAWAFRSGTLNMHVIFVLMVIEMFGDDAKPAPEHGGCHHLLTQSDSVCSWRALSA